MEGAAVAHVAHLHGMPVGEVRGISNIVTNRDTRSVAIDRTRSCRPTRRLSSAQSWTRQRRSNFAFSPCPNDTFAFHALVHGLVPGRSVTPHLDDIEALNIRAGDATPPKSPRSRSPPTGTARAIDTSCCARRRGRVRCRADRRRAIAARGRRTRSRFPASARPRRCCCGSSAASTPSRCASIRSRRRSCAATSIAAC